MTRSDLVRARFSKAEETRFRTHIRPRREDDRQRKILREEDILEHGILGWFRRIFDEARRLTDDVIMQVAL